MKHGIYLIIVKYLRLQPLLLRNVPKLSWRIRYSGFISANPNRTASPETLFQYYSAAQRDHIPNNTFGSTSYKWQTPLQQRHEVASRIMNQPYETFQAEATTDTLDAHSQCRFDRPAANFDVRASSKDQLHGSRLLLQRPYLEKYGTPSYQGSTRATSTTDKAHKKIEKVTCLGSGFVGGLENTHHLDAPH